MLKWCIWTLNHKYICFQCQLIEHSSSAMDSFVTPFTSPLTFLNRVRGWGEDRNCKDFKFLSKNLEEDVLRWIVMNSNLTAKEEAIEEAKIIIWSSLSVSIMRVSGGYNVQNYSYCETQFLVLFRLLVMMRQWYDILLLLFLRRFFNKKRKVENIIENPS